MVWKEACKVCNKILDPFPIIQFKYNGYDLKIHKKCKAGTDQKTFLRIKMMENRGNICQKIYKVWSIILPYDILDIIGLFMNDYNKIEYVTGSPTITSYMIEYKLLDIQGLYQKDAQKDFKRYKNFIKKREKK